ncbi:MAG: hypothetical protein CM15mP19_00010 [Gammaproteobacteria bacterium]|nr:MAG: hypothetical protein CM15mP19_00010 [Gammaproteobacteria bacterium]
MEGDFFAFFPLMVHGGGNNTSTVQDFLFRLG